MANSPFPTVKEDKESAFSILMIWRSTKARLSIFFSEEQASKTNKKQPTEKFKKYLLFISFQVTALIFRLSEAIYIFFQIGISRFSRFLCINSILFIQLMLFLPFIRNAISIFIFCCFT